MRGPVRSHALFLQRAPLAAALSERQLCRQIYRYISKNKNIMKKLNIFCHSFQKVKPIYYIDSLHSAIFQAFFSWNFDDYGLQIMKTQNWVSQKNRILHNINKKRIFYTEMSDFWKVCSFLCTQYLVGPPFAWITASMQRGIEAISPWHCSGVMKTRLFW